MIPGRVIGKPKCFGAAKGKVKADPRIPRASDASASPEPRAVGTSRVGDQTCVSQATARAL
jgi:hypothetical protein